MTLNSSFNYSLYNTIRFTFNSDSVQIQFRFSLLVPMNTPSSPLIHFSFSLFIFVTLNQLITAHLVINVTASAPGVD
ncbi:hypothetical protein VN97_g9547 [Penicillium thymicola]|uniref:Uncharacterized protein n=1 Tax=Penicillium thymicola TaxID=293382 RepID=A0AAI9TB03_PENTH|nr:hypothetical protein VN97_g9547 [Penicillium thymicola]